MNLLISLTDKWANLPIWAWIVIAAVVLILIIVIAVVAAKAHRAKKEQTEEEGFSAPAEEVQPVTEPVQDEEAAPVTVKEEPAPAEKTVQEEPAKPAPAPAPAQKAPAQQKPVQQKAEQAKPAAAKPAPAAKPVQKAEKPSEQPEEQPAAQSAYVPQAAAQTKVYHITKRKSDGKWQVKFNNGKKAIKLFDTQNQAIDYAKALAQNQEAGIMIHKEDGTFRKLRYDKPNKQ